MDGKSECIWSETNFGMKHGTESIVWPVDLQSSVTNGPYTYRIIWDKTTYIALYMYMGHTVILEFMQVEYSNRLRLDSGQHTIYITVYSCFAHVELAQWTTLMSLIPSTNDCYFFILAAEICCPLFPSVVRLGITMCELKMFQHLYNISTPVTPI